MHSSGGACKCYVSRVTSRIFWNSILTKGAYACMRDSMFEDLIPVSHFRPREDEDINKLVACMPWEVTRSVTHSVISHVNITEVAELVTELETM